MTRLLPLIGCILAICAPALALQDAPDDANAMLQALTELRPPQFDQSKREDQAYVQSYIEQRQAFVQKRCDMIKDFVEKFPEHPQAGQLMQERWMNLTGMGKGDEVVSEIDAALAGQTDQSNRADLLFQRAGVLMRGSQRDTAKINDAVEQFIKAAPKDERGGQLLYQAARTERDQAKQAQMMQRVIADYPDSEAATRAKGSLRQAEGVGKPFDLAFTEAMTGKQISMADLKGKVVAIDFWATWCGPCIAEMPKMKELYAQYKPKGVEFIGISLDNPESQGGLEKLKAYCKENNIEWPQYYQGNGWQSEFSMSWGINAIPSVFIIDADGNLHSTQARGQLERLIPELLAKRDGKSV